MSLLAKAALPAAVAVAGLAMSPPVAAGTYGKQLFLDPAVSCQLSIPTVDTAVRPRATGYRNEGVSNAFVICGLGHTISTGLVQYIQIQFNSFDGATHNFSCTGVNRQSNGGLPVYSVKPVSVTSSVMVAFEAADLGSFSGFANSVTCLLPPGVGITGLRVGFDDEIGT